MKDKTFWVQHLNHALSAQRPLVENRDELVPLLEHYQKQRGLAAWRREKMLLLEWRASRLNRKIRAWEKRIVYYRERIKALEEVPRFRRILKSPPI
jgi:hypothetical protein